MSFFGFDTTLPNDRPPARESRGIFEAPDPFSEVARATAHGFNDGDDAIDFEDTYDGLGDRLDDAQDAFNEDTFGEAAGNEDKPVGKDFDFFGQTAQMTNILGEEQVLYNLKHQNEQPQPSVSPDAAPKPKRTGYEPYQDPGYIPEIQAKSSVWGTGITQKVKTEQPKPAAPSKKMMSLEEVEAQMRAQSQRPQHATEATAPPPSQQFPATIPQGALSNLRFPEQPFPQPDTFPQLQQKDFPPLNQHQQYPPPQGFQRQPPRPFPEQKPRQNIDTLGYKFKVIIHTPRHRQLQGRSYLQSPNAPTVAQLSETSQALLAEDAKRAKRIIKFTFSRKEWLDDPADKTLITRIQLQQLVSGTGKYGERQIPISLLSEDFYYQVYSPNSRVRPDSTQDSLSVILPRPIFSKPVAAPGAIWAEAGIRPLTITCNACSSKFSRAFRKNFIQQCQTPKTLLNIKRPDSADGHKPANVKKGAQTGLSPSDRKSILNNIENAYDTLMRMEDHERKMPPPPDAEDAEAVQKHLEWRQKMDALNRKLWTDMKVHEPIFPGSTTTHPFIAFLSYPKGKKAIPRIFRHIDQEQRVTILTMIIVHLDSLDVVQRAQLQPGETQPPGPVREEIDLFSQAVMPSLLGYVTEAPLKFIIGLVGLVIFRTNVQAVSKTRIGLGILTMLLSRAELVKEAGAVDDEEWKQWTDLYNQLFDRLEPILGSIFPGTINSGDDMYVWQFLAAVGIGASPEQQQRLVIAVKDRVMETVAQSKTLPADMASQRLGNVNLFMRALGLDVELLG
ncbi:topisomerase II associated protein [Coccidioides posadasii str. Silveira]|uniref:Topisomerase II associated protein n=1 Tax=Coccidioides posadasii (strain RMSCC 757 / Silveira) TaxID=443226 RepID=E9DCY0_COCPS|nr:topisomerase II associated protein [Coccidioides posadasii str. Silveira]